MTIAVELFLLAYIWLLGLRPYKVPMRDIVGGKWERWADFWRDVGVAFVFWVAIAVMLLVVSATLHFSGSEAAKFLLPQTAAEMAVWVVLAWTAGFCEEFIFRGYLQRQFLAWTGSTTAAVILQGLVFGAAHWYQGWKGVVVIAILG
jgi:membrane protease YdiL (CAAX protease family)